MRQQLEHMRAEAPKRFEHYREAAEAKLGESAFAQLDSEGHRLDSELQAQKLASLLREQEIVHERNIFSLNERHEHQTKTLMDEMNSLRISSQSTQHELRAQQ